MIWRWAELIYYYLLRFHGQNVKMPNLEPFEEEVTVTGAIRQRNQCHEHHRSYSWPLGNRRATPTDRRRSHMSLVVRIVTRPASDTHLYFESLRLRG